MKSREGQILLVRERFGHMGRHSGYDLLAPALGQIEGTPPLRHVERANLRSFPRLLHILTQPLVRRAGGSIFYNYNGMLTELAVACRRAISDIRLTHFMYLENDFGWFRCARRPRRKKLIATAHMPPGWWTLRHGGCRHVASLDGLIVLAGCQRRFFENWLSPEAIAMIPHGVDTHFFTPAPVTNDAEGSIRCIFAGVNLRDFATLAEVIDRVLARDRTIRFDLVIPLAHRQDPSLFRIARHDQVCWHSGLSDEGLRDLYRRATLMLMPLIDATANNSLLEAMACGLPIVVSRIEGIQDYLDDTRAMLVPPDDAVAMADAILDLGCDADSRRKLGHAARMATESRFAWDLVAHRTLDFYRQIIDGPLSSDG